MKKIPLLLRIIVLSLLVIMAVVPVFALSKNKVNSNSIKVENNRQGVVVVLGKQADADRYKIYRREGSGKFVQIANVKAALNLRYVDKTAVGGRKYQYYALPVLKSGKTGSKTDNRTIIYLGMPKINSVQNGDGGIELDWSPSVGAEEYKVYRMKGIKAECIARKKASDGCTYTDTKVTSGKKYTYKVVASKGKFISDSEYCKSQKYLPAPQMKRTSNEDGCVSVSWSPVSGAEEYILYRKTASSDWRLTRTLGKDSLSYKDSSVESGNSYFYVVEAVKGSSVSGRDENIAKADYINIPKNIRLANSGDAMNVKWNSVDGALRYLVYRKNGDKDWVQIACTTETSYSDISIEDGVSYTYTVKAESKSGGLSAQLSGETITAMKSLTLKLYAKPDRVALKWSPASSATGYKVYRKLSTAKNWTCIGTIKNGKSSGFEDTKVMSGEKYIYTIRQTKGSVYGSFDAKGTAITFRPAPTLKAVLSPKGVKLMWTKAGQGTGYVIDRYISAEKTWKPITTINKNSTLSYEHSGAAYGKENYYRVRVKGVNMITNTETIYAIDPNKPVVALTYDDGPHPTVTNDILDVLEKYNAKATFFVVGSRVGMYKDCIKREVELGCEIGNHTYNHTILTSAGKDKREKEIESTNDAVEKLTGIRPIIVRPPGGAVNSSVKATVKYPLVNWSVDTLDWKNRNASSVVSIAKRDIKDGSVVLMHDLYGSTANATKIIVPWLIEEGYQLVTVTQLMQLKGIYMEPGKLYYSAY